MFQARLIPLDGADRTRGERFDIAATGGLYFESAPAGMRVSFNESAARLPVRAGRDYQQRFTTFTLYHAPGYSGMLSVVTYEKDEGIFDTGAGSGASAGANTSIVLAAVGVQFNPVGTRPSCVVYNPPGSEFVYTLQRSLTFQAANGNNIEDEFVVGTVLPSAFNDMAPGPACMYADAARVGVTPPLRGGMASTVASLNTAATTDKAIKFSNATGGELQNDWLAGTILRPGSFAAWSPIPQSGAAYWKSSWLEQPA